MKKGLIILCLLLGSALGCFGIDLRVDRSEDYDVILKRLRREEFSVWSLVPKDEKWQQFTAVKLDGETKNSVVALLRTSEFSKTGGEFEWREMPFDKQKKIGQGLLIVEFNNREMFGYRYKATMVNMSALGFVNIKLFNPIKNQVVWEGLNFINGVRLKKDIRPVIAVEQP